jgi:acyl-homoserine lactone acylase PvdQ
MAHPPASGLANNSRDAGGVHHHLRFSRCGNSSAARLVGVSEAAVNATGNSGHAYNRNHSDQIDTWVAGDQFPWPFSDEAVRAAARNTLTLIPDPEL